MLSPASGATSLIAARISLSLGCTSFGAAATYSSTLFHVCMVLPPAAWGDDAGGSVEAFPVPQEQENGLSQFCHCDSVLGEGVGGPRWPTFHYVPANQASLLQSFQFLRKHS